MPRDTQTQDQAAPEPFRPRYPAIEKLVDSEDFDALNHNYGQAYDELEKLAKQKGVGGSRDSKKAMKALELVMDLLKYLLKLKYEYLASIEGGDQSPQKNLSGDTQLQGERVR